MANWRVTATTIYCDDIDDEATILIYGDGAIKCTSYARYGNPDKYTENLLKKKSKELKRSLKCQGPECHRLIKYRDKLFDEDSNK
jgi:hypothetical protein